MSTLWTPGGEVPVGDNNPAQGQSQGQAPPGQPPNPPGQPPNQATTDGAAVSDAAMSGEDPLAHLSEQERNQAEAIAQQMAEARAQIANTPAAVVVGNHAMGLYELGAIHLSQQPPNIEEARLAIDALAVIVEGLQGRLGEHEATLKDALHQIRMAFVQVSRVSEMQPPAAENQSEDEEDEPAG